MVANKIKSLLRSKGYSMRKYCMENGLTYQNFTRDIREGVLLLSDAEEIAIKLNLTQREIIEFFLPVVFEKLKQNDSNV